MIEEKKEVLMNDIKTVRQRLSEYEQKKTEDTALINALTGALQQCDVFLKEIADKDAPMPAEKQQALDIATS